MKSSDTTVDMVTQPGALRQVCDALAAAGVFGFDTEFIRERSYLPQLCLVQVATASEVWVIDPLQTDMAPLWQLVADPSIRKIAHAPEQDLELCYLQSQRTPANIFDVQVAAGLVGLHYPISYGRLVQAITGKAIIQDQTVSDWSRRPLSGEQLEYARDDVRYLVGIAAELQRRLEKYGRSDWMAQEMAQLEHPAQYVADSKLLYRKVHGWKQLHRKELAVLQELALWREGAAADDNMPPRTFLRDPVLLALARYRPLTPAGVRNIRGLPRPVADRHAPRMIAAIERGAGAEKEDCPPPDRTRTGEDSVDQMLIDLASALGQSLCLGGNMAPALLATRKDYADLVRCVLREQEDSADTALAGGWRAEFAGNCIRGFLAGQGVLRVNCRGGKTRLTLE
ncbi:MAG: ribonuclease D [Planctomycetaceae bacterium]|nr:ribonuclease D [Planctomycetaceae bacterium]